jgi:protein-arginine kinase activator protein McsA
VPDRARHAIARQRLETALAEAVGRQQFEQAARLRDQIRALESATDAPAAGVRGKHA